MRRSTDAALQKEVMEAAIRQLSPDEQNRYQIVLLRILLKQGDGLDSYEREQHEADLHRTEQLVGLRAAHEQ